MYVYIYIWLCMLNQSQHKVIWFLQKKKSVWIKLPIELVNLVEPAVKVIYIIFLLNSDLYSS